MKTIQYYANPPYFHRNRQIIFLVVAILLLALIENPVRAEERLYKSTGMDSGKIIQVADNGKTNKANNQGINSQTNSDVGETKLQSESDSATLEKVTVEADAYDPDWAKDPYNPDYVLPNATSGTKTDTPIMETPLNVQVISKQVMKDQQVINLNQALKNVSGVTTTNQAGNGGNFMQQLLLRGFPTSALFRDGFRMDAGLSSFGFSQQFANVESVEVLKGPAAILYGRAEPGGMVNITTKQPLATPYYALNQQFGSYDLYRTSIDASGPLTKDDALLYRVNASFQSNNSFRDLVKGENVFFAPILKWNISPRTQATLEMEYQRELSSLDFQELPFDEAKQRFENLPHNRNLSERNPLETENIFVGFNWSHQFNDDWSIKHLVAFKRQDYNQGAFYFPFIFDGRQAQRANLGAAHFTTDTVATNLDLTGHFKTWGLEHTLLFGGDYYRYDTSSDQFTNILGLSSISIDNPVHPGPVSEPDPASRTLSNNGIDNYGLYLQDQIKLPYNVHVMGGLRYQYVHSTTKSGSFGTVLTPDPPLTDDAVTPRVGLLWQPRKSISLYSNYTENFGANAGAFSFVGNDSAGKPLAPKPLPSTSAQQWEAGIKTEFFDGRFRATLAYYDLTKQNVATSDPNLGHICPQGCRLLEGEVRSRGPELDIQGEILPGWNVIATYANQDVRITKSKAGDEGKRLEFTPRNIGSVWTTYEVQQGVLDGFKIGGGVTVQDGVVDVSNTFKSPGYALVSLMAGYSFEVGKSKITAQLNVDNLLDKSYISNATPAGFASFSNNFGFVNFSTPRTFMGSINIQY